VLRAAQIALQNILRNQNVLQKQHDLGGDNFAQLWRSAQHRRSMDASLWFIGFLKERSLSRSITVGALLRLLMRNRESFVLSETGRAAFKDASIDGGRGGR
jgi:hypothetical protein